MDKVLLLADNAVCHQPEEESLVPPSFLLVLHVPTAQDRRMVLPEWGLEMAKL